ncbi:hypothetical protein ACFW04_006067 [Cataglyphis niger]
MFNASNRLKRRTGSPFHAATALYFYHRLLFNQNIIILSGNCHIRVLSRQCSNRGNKSKMQHWKWISDTT